MESRRVSGHELKEDGVPYEVEDGRVDANGNFGHINRWEHSLWIQVPS